MFLEGGLDPQWSPDGRRLLFFSLIQNKDVMFIADSNGANPRQVFEAQPGEHNHFMGWSADGRYIGFFGGGKLKKSPAVCPSGLRITLPLWAIPSRSTIERYSISPMMRTTRVYGSTQWIWNGTKSIALAQASNSTRRFPPVRAYQESLAGWLPPFPIPSAAFGLSQLPRRLRRNPQRPYSQFPQHKSRFRASAPTTFSICPRVS